MAASYIFALLCLEITFILLQAVCYQGEGIFSNAVATAARHRIRAFSLLTLINQNITFISQVFFVSEISIKLYDSLNTFRHHS